MDFDALVVTFTVAAMERTNLEFTIRDACRPTLNRFASGLHGGLHLWVWNSFATGDIRTISSLAGLVVALGLGRMALQELFK